MIGLAKNTFVLTATFLLAFLTMNAESFSPSAGGTYFFNKPVIGLKKHQSIISSSTQSSFSQSRSSSRSSLSSINNDENNDLTPSSLLTPSNIANWANENKVNIAASAALIAAAAFASPSTALASTASDVVTASSSYWDRLIETGFYQAFSLVFVSEIGDKTFFIAGLLAMKAGKLVSLIGSIGALAVMTVISVIIGQLFHAVPPGLSQGLPLDDIAAVLAFAFFGFKTLKEASEIDEDGVSGMDEEFADAEEAVEGSRTIKEVTAWGKIISTFGLVFAAEFGDRSFLSTIALSAAQNPVSVAAGAIAAHAVATCIAVAGGSYVAKYISEKVIGYIGGTLFIIFAITTALGIF